MPCDSGRYLSLQHLVFHLREDVTCEHLFWCCPNLLTAEFRGAFHSTALPAAPLPHSITHVTLRVWYERIATADFASLLLPWYGARIPRLSLLRIALRYVEPLIPIFLASHNLPVKLVTYSNHDKAEFDVVMSSEPDGEFCWEIGTSSFWHRYDCFGEFRFLCAERLTALSIPLMHFWACCYVRTLAPHLEDLELRLSGRQEIVFAWDGPEQGFCLRAPRLRRVVLDVDDSFMDYTPAVYETTVFDTLDGDFRALLVYDADLLDSIVVRCAFFHVGTVSSHDLARFAKRYILNGHELSGRTGQLSRTNVTY